MATGEAVKKYPHHRDLTELDCTGNYLVINDPFGREWFRGKALERISGNIYQFQVFKIGGRVLEAELIVDIGAIGHAATEVEGVA